MYANKFHFMFVTNYHLRANQLLQEYKLNLTISNIVVDWLKIIGRASLVLALPAENLFKVHITIFLHSKLKHLFKYIIKLKLFLKSIAESF